MLVFFSEGNTFPLGSALCSGHAYGGRTAGAASSSMAGLVAVIEDDDDDGEGIIGEGEKERENGGKEAEVVGGSPRGEASFELDMGYTEIIQILILMIFFFSLFFFSSFFLFMLRVY